MSESPPVTHATYFAPFERGCSAAALTGSRCNFFLHCEWRRRQRAKDRPGAISLAIPTAAAAPLLGTERAGLRAEEVSMSLLLLLLRRSKGHSREREITPPTATMTLFACSSRNNAARRVAPFVSGIRLGSPSRLIGSLPLPFWTRVPQSAPFIGALCASRVLTPTRRWYQEESLLSVVNLPIEVDGASTSHDFPKSEHIALCFRSVVPVPLFSSWRRRRRQRQEVSVPFGGTLISRASL